MSGFDYYYARNAGIRVSCDCSLNEVADTAGTLKKADPTPKEKANGWVEWTEADSRKLGIDHTQLREAWEELKARDLVCRADFIAPGCSYTMEGSWFKDQRERIEAILQKREPNLKYWNFSPPASENLKRMGIRVTSPFPLFMEWYPTNDPKPEYIRQPSATNISLLKGKDTILEVSVENVSFVDISDSPSEDDEWRNVEILVAHKNGKVSFYIISNGRIVHQQVQTPVAQIHR